MPIRSVSDGDKAVVDVLLERVALSLPFMASLLILMSEPALVLVAISAWNPNLLIFLFPMVWDRRDSRFVIHINRNADDSAQLSSICHELGHFLPAFDF